MGRGQIQKKWEEEGGGRKVVAEERGLEGEAFERWEAWRVVGLQGEGLKGGNTHCNLDGKMSVHVVVVWDIKQ